MLPHRWDSSLNPCAFTLHYLRLTHNIPKHSKWIVWDPNVQAAKVFGDVDELMEFLIDNRRQWHVRWLAELDADASKSPTERAAEKVWPDRDLSATT